MNRDTIWKYHVRVDQERQTIKMPSGARILDAQLQRKQVVLWALVDPDMPEKEYTIWVWGTGQPAPTVSSDKLRFISTVQIIGELDTLVLHFFEDVA